MSRARTTTALACALAATAAALAPAAASAAPTWIVRGAGFGHGIGMSQYGAYGLAQEGWSYDRILRHYYRGTTLGEAPSRPVRVLLQASDPYVRFKGATRGPSRLELEPGVIHVVKWASGGRLALYGRGSRRLGTFRGPLKVSRAGGRPVQLMGPAINGVSSGSYRGTLELHPGALGGVTAVNALPMDDYVQGVVPGEMPYTWDPDALRVQAVAARTYALATRKTDSRLFDQYPDTRSQVYRGVVAETARTNAAVRASAGDVVMWQGAPAVTYYFSTSGGKTENVENSFIGSTPKPWLKSVDDPYDGISPKHRWSFRFSNATLGARLGAPGTLRDIRVLQRGRSPRIVRARIYGSRGSRVLTGPDIRFRLGLYDTWASFKKVPAARVAGSRRR